MNNHSLPSSGADRRPPTADRPSFLISYFLFLFIILIAAFLRLHHLPSLPPGLNFDEAGSGVAAREILNGAPKIWWRLGGGQEPLWPYLAAVTTALWGNLPFSLRLPAALVGILTVAAAYRLALTLFAGHRNRHLLALCTALGLALSDWHVHFSRLGFRAILLPLFSTLAFHFFWQAVRSQKLVVSSQKIYVLRLVLAAFFTALAMYSYLAARLLFVIPLIFLVLQLLIQRGTPAITKLRSYLPFLSNPQSPIPNLPPTPYSLLLTSYYLPLLLFLAPLILYFAFNPADFMARSTTVSIFNPQWNQGDLWGVAWRTLTATLGTFFGLSGDANPLVNLPGQPALPLLLVPFFSLGLLLSLYHTFSPPFKLQSQRDAAQSPISNLPPSTLPPIASSPHLFLLCWWLAMLLPAVLAPEGAPHHLRLLGTIAPTYAFVAIGLVSITNFLYSLLLAFRSSPPASRLVYLLPAACYLVIALQTYTGYFIRWPNAVDFTLPFDLYAVRLADDITHAPPQTAYILPMDLRAGDEARHYTLDYLLRFTPPSNPPPFHYLPVDEHQAAAVLTQAAQGKTELRVVRWTQDKHREADAKEIITYLLETTARRVEQAEFPVYTVETYTLPGTQTVFALPAITRPVQADFALPETGQVALRLEAAFVPHTLAHSQWLPVAATLAPLAPMSSDYKASVRLVSPAGERVSQKDRVLLHNYHQGTSLWPPETVNEYYLLPLPPKLPPGDYTVTLLIYQPDTLAPLLTNGAVEAVLGQVRLE